MKDAAIQRTEFFRIASVLFSECDVTTRAPWYTGDFDYEVVMIARYPVEHPMGITAWLTLELPRNTWLSTSAQIATIFDARVSVKALASCITACFEKDHKLWIPSTRRAEPALLPEHVIKAWCIDIFSQLRLYYEREADCLIPLQNLIYHSEAVMPLANAFLHMSGENSMLASSLSRTGMLDEYKDFVRLPFLEIRVKGDDESIDDIARVETENALVVLRFTHPWVSPIGASGPETHNDASGVTPGTRANTCIEVTVSRQEPSRVTVQSKLCRKTCVIDDHRIASARERYALESINYHFRNDTNPVSQAIVRAIKIYDTGTQSKEKLIALYNYAIAVNVAYPIRTHNGKFLARCLETSIEKCGSYLGVLQELDAETTHSMALTPDVEITPEAKWKQILRKTTRYYESIYSYRGRIVHGNLIDYSNIDNDTIENARQLAFNAIRSMAILAMSKKWSGEEQIKQWFDEQMGRQY